MDPDGEPPEEFFASLGRDRDYNIDLIPKFIMADGKLVQLLIKTDVKRYLDFKRVDGSFVFSQYAGKGIFTSGKPGYVEYHRLLCNHIALSHLTPSPLFWRLRRIEKVPATPGEARSTSLVGMRQKWSLKSFLEYCSTVDMSTGRGEDGTPLESIRMSDLYERFSLDADTQEFVGHSLALQFDEQYKDRPALDTVRAIRLYVLSLQRFGVSPFIYPEYGLTSLSEAFSRDCAVRGGTFMLDQAIDEVMFDGETNRAVGVRSGEGEDAMVATADIIIGDPSYFPESMTRRTGSVIRTICILQDRPPCLPEDVNSAQIIIPQAQVGRRNDVYISILSSAHRVVAPGKFVAIVSTKVETEDPRSEVTSGLQLLGRLTARFDNIVPTLEPVNDGTADGCFITSSYDASSHFESTMADVLRVYKTITGEDFSLENEPREEEGGAAGGGGGAEA